MIEFMRLLLLLALLGTACSDEHLIGFGCDGPVASISVVVLDANQPALNVTMTTNVVGDTLTLSPSPLPVTPPNYVVFDDGMWEQLHPSTPTVLVTATATVSLRRVTGDFEIGYQNCAVVKVAGPDTLRLP